MKQRFFEAVHNLIAHPLLTIAKVLRIIPIIIGFVALLIRKKKGRHLLDGPFPKWIDKIDPNIYAEKFHDWTETKSY